MSDHPDSVSEPSDDEPASGPAADIPPAGNSRATGDSYSSGGPYAAAPQAIRLYRSEELFAGGRIVCIEHAGSTYRLQITSRGKLILQK